MSRSRFVLGIDTASREGSIALAVDGAAISSLPLPPGGHSSGLSRAGESLLHACGIGWKDLAGVAVSEGPGSFTGLRIGLAWAKGVCFGSRAKLILVPAHEAHAHRHREASGPIATVLPGERGEAKCALWSGGKRTTLLRGPESVAESDLPRSLRGMAAAAVVAPDLKPELVALLREAGLRLLGADAASPAAAAVAELGDQRLLAGGEEDLARSAPVYGREPNARKPAP